MTRPSELIVTVNGSRGTELEPVTAETIDGELASRLGRLDGEKRFSLTLWTLPDEVEFIDVNLDDHPPTCIQCAGSFDDRLTCEVRDGEGQFVLGRGSQPAAAPDDVVIHA